MMLVISSLSVGCGNIVLSLSFERLSKMFMLIFYAFFCSFSCGSKVIIKNVSNIIGIGYGITIIKGDYNWFNGCYSF